MKILYVDRVRPRAKMRRRLAVAFKGFTDGQEGFFEAALHQAGRVQKMQLGQALALAPAQLAAFDAVVINARCGLEWNAPPRELDAILGSCRGARALFLHMAHPRAMPPDAVLDGFDVVFKREPWRDLERYALSPANRAKIVPTHLSNPFLKTSTTLPFRNRNKPLPVYGWQTAPQYDVGFLGSIGNGKIGDRQQLWERVLDEGFTPFGGLFADKGGTLPPRLMGRKLGKPAYLREVRRCAINLALAGHGPFTYRHLELLWVGAFVLSPGVIREQRLRAPLVDGQDYASFDTPDEMIEKIRHYLAHPAERIAIARNGRAAYERLHDVAAHAEEIATALRDGARAVTAQTP